MQYDPKYNLVVDLTTLKNRPATIEINNELGMRIASINCSQRAFSKYDQPGDPTYTDLSFTSLYLAGGYSYEAGRSWKRSVEAVLENSQYFVAVAYGSQDKALKEKKELWKDLENINSHKAVRDLLYRFHQQAAQRYYEEQNNVDPRPLHKVTYLEKNYDTEVANEKITSLITLFDSKEREVASIRPYLKSAPIDELPTLGGWELYAREHLIQQGKSPRSLEQFFVSQQEYWAAQMPENEKKLAPGHLNPGIGEHGDQDLRLFFKVLRDLQQEHREHFFDREKMQELEKGKEKKIDRQKEIEKFYQKRDKTKKRSR